MAQFDAFDNPNAAQREAYPYVVVLQSDLLDSYSTRLAMPLVRGPGPARRLPHRLAETVVVSGERLFLAAHLCAAVPARLLRRPVESLRDQSAAIRDALDAVVSGV